MLRKVERKGRWHGRRLDYPSLHDVPRIGILMLVEDEKPRLEIEIAGGVFHFHSEQEVEEFRGSCLNLLLRAQADIGKPIPTVAEIEAAAKRTEASWSKS